MPTSAGAWGVGGEGDGDAELEGELDDGGTGIDFFAIFAQAGGVELHGQAAAFGRFQKAAEERSAVLLRIKAEFLAEVGVGDDVEQTGFGGHGKALEVNSPNFHRVAVFPLGNLAGVVQVPGFGDIMHGANEVVPWMPCGEVAYPIFAAGQ